MKIYFNIWMMVALFAISSLQAATLQPRIIGGTDADPGEWPGTVALLQASTYESQTLSGVATGEAQYNSRYCDGSLVAPGWVMTAAHCMFNFGVKFQPAEILVLAAVTDITDTGQLLSVSNIIIHPDFNAVTYESDIALMQLNTAAVVPAEVLHLFEGAPDVGSNATVVGWGVLDNGNFPTVLQEAEVQVVSNTACNAASSYSGAITDNMLCAAAPGKDSCGGDSGGPLMAAQDGEFHQIGIVSFGNNCALPDFPGVYTRVEQFHSWIDSHINLPPTALAEYVITDEDTAVAITLQGTDPDGDPLTYSIMTQPANGLLSGSAPDLTYTPDPGYNGADSFTFQVNDGSLNSAEETVSIAVNGVNDAPVAQPQTVITDEDTTVQLTLTGLDSDGDPLNFTVVTEPASGQLTATLPDLGYTPNPDFNGTDSFTFQVDDGNISSAPETVSLIVNAVNDPPTADPQTVVTDENTAITFTLTGLDPDDDPLTYEVVTQPANGSVTVVGNQITYTPNPGFSGSDNASYQVSDGLSNSDPANITITVEATPVPTGKSSGGGGSFNGFLLLAGVILLRGRKPSSD